MSDPHLIGIDLGTTKIVAIALDGRQGEVVAKATRDNEARLGCADERAAGRSEWDADAIVRLAMDCLREVSRQLGPRRQDVAGIGVTGQQHGVLLVDGGGRAVTPLINWQDRRGLDLPPGEKRSYVELARQRLGTAAARRAGCLLQPGFMAVTLFWLHQNGRLPKTARACFLMDYFVSRLTSEPPRTDPSCAASAGVLDVRRRAWDADAITELGLSLSLFPELGEANQTAGSLSAGVAQDIELPVGVPMFIPIGDHQASFLGSVSDSATTAVLNVGTGAQVAAFTTGVEFQPPVELRPFPIHGNLLSSVGLPGGWSYQLLEGLFRDIGRRLFRVDPSGGTLYEAMNVLAAEIPAGADGLRCEPTFTGTRTDPAARGSIAGLEPRSLTAAHLVRSVLEGMARSYREAYERIAAMGGTRHQRLAAAGNGLRANAVLAQIVQEVMGMPVCLTNHPEEAAFGSALIAAVGSGVSADLAQAGKWVRYLEPVRNPPLPRSVD
jgi:sugar (pentulose or hexulose) kinase